MFANLSSLALCVQGLNLHYDYRYARMIAVRKMLLYSTCILSLTPTVLLQRPGNVQHVRLVILPLQNLAVHVTAGEMMIPVGQKVHVARA